MQQERDTAKSFAQFIVDAMGSTQTYFTGLAATPATGLQVQIGVGAVYQYGQIDPTTWAGLAADTWQGSLLGLSLAAKTLSGFTAPATAGQSINYLIEAQVQVQDVAAVNLPFTNGATPPATVYASKSPSRQNVVVFQVKAGTAAATGSQVTPTADAGWIPLYAVTVDNGESSLTSGDIVSAANAPAFYGFVHTNPNGNTPVFLSPSAQQTGFINISGNATVGEIIAADALFGGASATANFDGTWANGFAGDFLKLTAAGFTGSAQSTDSLDIAGSIGYVGTHAGTDADPYPQSQLNVAMLGGKLASDYALASGHYITLYTGAPTADPTNLNAAIGGYFEANVAQGTAPIQVISTTQCPNLNAQYVGGFAPGNATGEIPVSNGTVCTNLNAQLLDGLTSAAFQPAGSYAILNAENTGDFSVSGQFFSYGGTGSQQLSLGYMASNGFGINGGGPMTFVNSFAAPIALLGPSVRTDGPLYVGDGTRQNAYMQDLIPSGVVRSGMCIYTVTYGGTSNAYPYPGNGTAWGTYGSVAGQLNVGTDRISTGKFWIGFRCKVTCNASVAVNFNGIGFASGTIYVDGADVGQVGGNINGCSRTLSAGTHTIDIIYAAARLALEYYEGSAQGDWGGSLTMFGWLPMSGGQVSNAITAIVPG